LFVAMIGRSRIYATFRGLADGGPFLCGPRIGVSVGGGGIPVSMTGESSTPAQDKNISAIGDMEGQALLDRSRGERISEVISGLASTSAFALAHLVFFIIWLVSQSGFLPGIPVFDPFPFTFLTLVVSLEAIFLTIFVLISQTRLTRQTDLRSHLDLQVNLLAEQESTKTLKVLYAIAEHLKVPDLPSDEELGSETSVRKLIEGISGATE
jgi:uncharacterized membrane protein